MPSLSRSRDLAFCVTFATVCWLAGDLLAAVAEEEPSTSGASPRVTDPSAGFVAPLLADPVAKPPVDRELPDEHPLGPAPVLPDPPDPSDLRLGDFQPQPDEPGRYEEVEPMPDKITGPRELLRAYGIDESYFNQLIDGRPVNDEEKEVLLRLMYRLRSFTMTDFVRWAEPELNLPEGLEDSAEYRGLLFQLRGRLTKVGICHIAPETAERFGFDAAGAYYRCELLLDEGRQPAVVFTRRVPKQWREGGSIDARAGAFGLLLKFAGEDEQRPVPVFLAPRIAWYPDTLLGNLGMDVGLLDTVRNRTDLTKQDREAFYQMLFAVGQAEPGRLIRDAREQLKNAGKNAVRTDRDGKRHYSVVPLFNKPDTQRGRLVMLSGVAKRTLRIPVSDADVVERFGIRHYYELYVYTDDSQDNPVVFCVRKLPEGMPAGDGPDYSEYVEVAGFFFKTWAYDSRARTSATITSITEGPVETLPNGTKTAVTLLAIDGGAPKGLRGGNRVNVDGTGVYDTDHEVLEITEGGLVVTDVPYTQDVSKSGMTMSGWTRLQLAPLLIGGEPIWEPGAHYIPNHVIGAIAGGLFVVTLVGIWFALWCYGRGDRVFHERALAKRFAPAGNVSLNEIGFQDSGGPDFSDLEKMEREAAELRKKETGSKD